MSLLPQPVFNKGSESSSSVPHHLPLGESQPKDVEPLPKVEEDDDTAEFDPVPTAPASVENGNRQTASGDLPSDPTLGVDAPNLVQSAPSSLVANADAAPNSGPLSPSFRENAPIGAHSFPANMAVHGMGENKPAGGRPVHIGSHILHGVLHSQPLPAFSFSAPSTSAAHPQPCWSAYSLFLEERFSIFRNLPSQSMGELTRLIEESWGWLTETERGVYTDLERMDRERYERELNEYQERIRRAQSK